MFHLSDGMFVIGVLTLMLATGIAAVVAPRRIQEITLKSTRKNGMGSELIRAYVSSDAYLGVTRAIGWCCIVLATLIMALGLVNGSMLR